MKKNLVKKRIAFFHELDKGGARRSSNEFAKNILNEFDVDLFIVDQKHEKNEDAYYSNVHLFKFKPKTWHGNNWKVRLYKDTIELIRLYFLHKRIAETINNQNYDAVFVLPSKYTQAPFILNFLKKPTIYYCQEPLRMVYEPLFSVGREVGFGRFYYEKTNRFIRKIIDRNNIKKADVLLSNSNYTGKNIKKAYGLNSKTIYMGVDVNFFKPQKAHKKIYDILYIGAYDKSENYDFLKKGLSEYGIKPEKIRLVFKEKEWISSNTDMRDLYRSAKIMVCLGYKEPFGLMPIEAMSCGLPVVALNDGGYKESVIPGQTGYLVPKKTASLVQAFRKALDEKNYKIMSENARKQALSKWSWAHSGVALSEIINSVVTS